MKKVMITTVCIFVWSAYCGVAQQASIHLTDSVLIHMLKTELATLQLPFKKTKPSVFEDIGYRTRTKKKYSLYDSVIRLKIDSLLRKNNIVLCNYFEAKSNREEDGFIDVWKPCRWRYLYQLSLGNATLFFAYSISSQYGGRKVALSLEMQNKITDTLKVLSDGMVLGAEPFIYEPRRNFVINKEGIITVADYIRNTDAYDMEYRIVPSEKDPYKYDTLPATNGYKNQYSTKRNLPRTIIQIHRYRVNEQTKRFEEFFTKEYVSYVDNESALYVAGELKGKDPLNDYVE